MSLFSECYTLKEAAQMIHMSEARTFDTLNSEPGAGIYLRNPQRAINRTLTRKEWQRIKKEELAQPPDENPLHELTQAEKNRQSYRERELRENASVIEEIEGFFEIQEIWRLKWIEDGEWENGEALLDDTFNLSRGDVTYSLQYSVPLKRKNVVYAKDWVKHFSDDTNRNECSPLQETASQKENFPTIPELDGNTGEGEYFSIKDVTVILGSNDEPLPADQVVEAATVHTDPRTNEIPPVLWPSFFRATPVQAQRIEYTGKRTRESALPGGGLEINAIDEEVAGYLDVSEWRHRHCPWDRVGHGAVLRFRKGELSYTVLEPLTIHKSELCFSAVAIKNYLIETGLDPKRLECFNREQTLPEPESVPPRTKATDKPKTNAGRKNAELTVALSESKAACWKDGEDPPDFETVLTFMIENLQTASYLSGIKEIKVHSRTQKPTGQVLMKESRIVKGKKVTEPYRRKYVMAAYNKL